MAATADNQCSECVHDTTFFTNKQGVQFKRRPPKVTELSQPTRYESTFRLLAQNRTNKHKQNPFTSGKQPFNVDSGATVSVTNDINVFESIDELRPNNRVQVANKQVIHPMLRGTVRLNMHDTFGETYSVLLRNVLYHPDFAGQLLSVDEMYNQHKFETVFRGKRAHFQTPDGRQIPIHQDDRNRYMLRAFSIVEDNAELWHRRLMHRGNTTLQRMGCVIPSLYKAKFDFSRCDACLQGGGRKQPKFFGKTHAFNRVRHQRYKPSKLPTATRFGQRISTDLCGPFPKSEDGMRYAIVFHDSCEKYIATYALRDKEKETVLEAFQQFLVDHQHFLPRGVETLWSDNGGEFVNRDMDAFCEEICVRRTYSVPYEPSQNPYAERAWGTILRPMRSSLAETGNQYERFWPHYLRQATLVHNIIPDDDCISPYERVHGEKFNYTWLHAMGSLSYYLLPNRDRKSKLSPRALPSIYLGRDPERRGDVVYVPSIRRLTTAYHLVFNEHRYYDAVLDPNRNVSFNDRPEILESDPIGTTRRHYYEDRDDDDATGPMPGAGDDVPADTWGRRLRDDLDYHPANDERHGTVSTRTTRGDWNENHCTIQAHCTFPDGHDGPCSNDLHREGHRFRPLRPQNYNENAHAACATNGCAFHAEHCGECIDRDTCEAIVDDRDIHRFAHRATSYDSSEIDPLTGADLTRTVQIAIDDVQHEVLHVDPSQLSKIPCPVRYEETQKSPLRERWNKSMQDEYSALMENDTWEQISRNDPRLRGRKPTKSRWVYAYKFDRFGAISRFKARFVVCGYSQKQGVDYERAFSATLRGTTFRTLLAVAAGKKLKLMQIDVSNAFTQAELDDYEVFVEPPKGFESYECCNRERKCICGKFRSKLLRLKRALYGTKQASRLWQAKLKKFLVEDGSIKFAQSAADPCVYRAVDGENEIILGVYVDDIIIAFRGQDFYNKFVTEFKGNKDGSVKGYFKATDPHRLEWFLGMAIDQHEDYSVHVSHEVSVQKIADKFIPGNFVSRECPSPDAFSKLGKPKDDIERAEAAEFEYASLVGALLYVAVTSRPDIAYHTSILAKFLSDPSPDCCKAAIILLQYLHSTKKKRLYFSGKIEIPDGLQKHTVDIEQNHGFVAYSDSSWGNQYPYPMFGYSVYLFGGLVSFASKQLKTVAFSSCEAEYAAASYACKEVEFVRNICADMGVILQGRLVLAVDNTACIDIAWNEGVSARTKHFDRAIHYLRDLTQLRRILPFYVNTTQQRADGFTKPLDKSSFTKWSSFVVR